MTNPVPYIPIACAFYDYLEEAATRKTEVPIVYADDQGTVEVTAHIINLMVINKVEYMELSNGQKVRLDKIISFDGRPLAAKC